MTDFVEKSIDLEADTLKGRYLTFSIGSEGYCSIYRYKR